MIYRMSIESRWKEAIFAIIGLTNTIRAFVPSFMMNFDTIIIKMNEIRLKIWERIYRKLEISKIR